jgi:hypothetical protein
MMRIYVYALVWLAISLVILVSACSGGSEQGSSIAESVTSTPKSAATPSTISPGRAGEILDALPAEARRSTGGGDPRTARTWVIWSTCGEGSQAETAQANGGREAGWFLLDDLLEDPGIKIGEYAIESCQDGVALLEGHRDDGSDTAEPVYELARQLLTAELNLGAGTEWCPIAEEVVLGGHLVLSAIGFSGTEGAGATPTDEIVAAMPELTALLMAYNTGELCQ